MAGRFLPQKDRDFFERINKELVGDLKQSKDGIINQKIVIHKISPYDTSTNMYGRLLWKIVQTRCSISSILPNILIIIPMSLTRLYQNLYIFYFRKHF